MIRAFFLSVGQLSDRRILLMLAKVVGLTLLLFLIFGVVVYFGIVWALAAFGWGSDSGLAAAATAAILAVVSAIFLFRVVAIAVLNIFSDEVVDAVEDRHYPQLAEQARPPNLALGARMGLISAARALLWNLLALPVYIWLLVTGIGTALLFLFVNSWLIGRDLQDMVASRHVRDGETVRAASARQALGKPLRFGLGLVVTLLLLVPVVNFLAPVIGAAMATHLVHRRAEGGTP